MIGMDSSLLREFQAPMSLISSSTTSQLLPSVLADCTSSDLNLGIDLSSIQLELDIATAFELDNQLIDATQLETGLTIQQQDFVQDRHASQEEEEVYFEPIDMLDFDLIDTEVLRAFSAENISTVEFSTVDEPQLDGSSSFTTTFGWNEQYEVSKTNLFNNSSLEEQIASILAPTPSAASLNEDASPMSNVSNIDDEEYDSSADSSPATSTLGSGSSKRTRVRRIDKKQSNKVAAIKYRTKKLKEREILFAECEEYVKRNNELKKKIDETQTEISFIKSLLVEALIAKNKT